MVRFIRYIVTTCQVRIAHMKTDQRPVRESECCFPPRHSLTYLKLGERYLLALLESRLDQRQERIGSIAIGIKFAHILV